MLHERFPDGSSSRRDRGPAQSLKIIWDIEPEPIDLELRVVDKGKRFNGVGLAESATLGGWETGRERLSSTAFRRPSQKSLSGRSTRQRSENGLG
jgi:hypothetical protein